MLLESPCLFIHLYLERLLVRWMGEHESHDLRPPTGSFHIFSWTNLSSGNPSLRIEIVVFACGQIQVARLGSYTLLVGEAGSSSLALPPCNLPPLGKWVLPLACSHPSFQFLDADSLRIDLQSIHSCSSCSPHKKSKITDETSLTNP